MGESGCGKTVTGFSILGLVDRRAASSAAAILFDGPDLLKLGEHELRQIRGARIAMVFQDPMMTLNPVLRIDTQMVEAVRAHQDVDPRTRTEDRARSARARRHSLARVAPALLPAPVQRRHAPARGDRHRAPQPARADHRRRADHRARRHHPGADPLRGAEALPRVRHRADLDHARPRRWSPASPTASA